MFNNKIEPGGNDWLRLLVANCKLQILIRTPRWHPGAPLNDGRLNTITISGMFRTARGNSAHWITAVFSQRVGKWPINGAFFQRHC